MFQYKDRKIGRAGTIFTPHGNIETPAFVFCATQGAIKNNIYIPDNTQILLTNTYFFQGKENYIDSVGGLHKFMGWNKPMIMDSGGYQIFSMGYGSVSAEIKGIRNSKSFVKKITEDGCTFINSINGDLMFLGAEQSMNIQIKLGTDLCIAFDECTASHLTEQYTEKSMHRSHRWEKRSLDYFTLNKKEHQKLYGIVQGGTYTHLRDQSINFVNENNFDGICIGGSLGKTKEEMYNIVKYTSNKLDKSRPIHLLGIGKVSDILSLYSYVDTFDCVEPTRIGRHGIALTNLKLADINNILDNSAYRINLRNAKFKYDFASLDENCNCFTCHNHTRAYIHYLLKTNDINAGSLITIHNMHFMSELMNYIRTILL